MRPFWHPISALCLDRPRCPTSEPMLRLMLRGGDALRLRAFGDRMWPALSSAAPVDVAPLGGQPPAEGEVVLVCPGGVPELLRVERSGADGTLWLSGDADAGEPTVLRADAVLGRAIAPRSRPTRRRRLAHRRLLDLREAIHGRRDAAVDPADTVRAKYESQAPSYLTLGGPDLAPALLDTIRDRARPEGTILVVGSGSGRECFALAEAGFRVGGIDFAPAMVAIAREEARRRGLAVDFEVADVREFDTAPASLAALLFTYDVYSFLPQAAERVALLRRIREWLAPRGVALLAARRVTSTYERAILTVQWMTDREAEWGTSHTRWLSPDGRLHRSFVRLFTDRQVRDEASAAGLRLGPWIGGHAILEPIRTAMIPSRLDDDATEVRP